MAISKIQYKSSANATPVVWMDVTQKTVTAGSMLNGTTALKNDGTDITGNIASKTSSDLTASNLTVTAPSGHYASNATKTLSDQNLVAENIKKDVHIFGVTGSYEGGGSSTLITKTITQNGTYDAEDDNADGYSSVTVNVQNYTWQEEYNATVTVQDLGEDVNYVWLEDYFQTHDAFALGDTYRVTWGNMQYICVTSYYIDVSGGGSGYCLGEPTLMGYPQSGNNEPFCGQCYWTDDLLFATTTSSVWPDSTFTLKIEKQVPAPAGLEYETGTWTPASDIASASISFSNSHTETPLYILLADATGTYYDTAYSSYMYLFTDLRKTGCPLDISSSTIRYGYIARQYRMTNTTSLSNASGNITNETDFSNYVSTTGFTAMSYSNSVYWRTGRTYKWIAVWAPST